MGEEEKLTTNSSSDSETTTLGERQVAANVTATTVY